MAIPSNYNKAKELLERNAGETANQVDRAVGLAVLAVADHLAGIDALLADIRQLLEPEADDGDD